MKTKLQIYRSAQQAAVDSLGCKNKFEANGFARDRFNSEKLDARDWDYWIENYDQSRQMFDQLAKQKSFSPVDPQPAQ